MSLKQHLVTTLREFKDKSPDELVISIENEFARSEIIDFTEKFLYLEKCMDTPETFFVQNCTDEEQKYNTMLAMFVAGDWRDASLYAMPKKTESKCLIK
jgi:hypothetical protein